MKVKNLLMFLSLLAIGTSCSNDDGLTDSSPDTATTPGIQLLFSGSGEGVDYSKAATKAIATEAENEMHTLKVYIFAAATKAGPYYYVETWEKAETLTDGAPNQFTLQASGSDQMAVIKPKEIVGLPYLKLYCVANSEPYTQDGATAITPTPVTAYDQDADAPTPGNPTTSDIFETTAFTATLATADPKPIATPLPMGGIGETKISGSLSKVNIEMTRAVARFDIYNDRLTSRLTITALGVKDGRKNAPLFSTATLPEVDTPDLRAAELLTYKDVVFTDLSNANRGDTESALYVCPGAVTDATLLIIKGTFQNPNGEEVDVTYPVAIKIEDTATPIGRNNRYKLRIGNVTESQVSTVFEIEDWTSGGGVITTPDNARPVFAGDDGKDLAASLLAIDGETAPLPEVKTDPYILRVLENKGSFKLATYASSGVEAELEELTRAGALWFTQDEVKTEQDTLHAGRQLTTFTFKYDNAEGQLPCVLTLRNEAASYDPDLWTSIIIKSPYMAPTLAAVADGNSTGNTLTIAGDGSGTSQMYTAMGSEVKVKITAVDSVAIDAPHWLTVAPVKGTEEGTTVTYSLKITNPAEAADSTVSFKNAEKEELLSSIAITLASPAMKAELNGSPAGVTLAQEGNDYTARIDINELGTNSFAFTVTAPEDYTAPLLANVSNWLTIEAGSPGVYNVSLKNDPADYNPCTLTFANAIRNGGDLTFTIKKAAQQPQFGTVADAVTYPNSEYNTALDVTNPAEAKVTMYKAYQSTIYAAVACAEGLATLPAVDGLSITEAAAGIYKIEVTDATLITTPTTEITLTNLSDEGLTSTLTITWKDAAITHELTRDGQGVATPDPGTPNTINIDYDSWTTFDSVVINLTGYKGSTITYSGLDAGWASAPSQPAEIPEGGGVTLSFAKVDGSSATTDIVITVKNAITQQEETITLKKVTN